VVQIHEDFPHLTSTVGFRKRIERASSKLKNGKPTAEIQAGRREGIDAVLFGQVVGLLPMGVIASILREFRWRYSEAQGPMGEIIPVAPASIGQCKHRVALSETVPATARILLRHMQESSFMAGVFSGHSRLRKVSLPYGRIVATPSLGRTLTVETIGTDNFTAIWEQEGQPDRRVRFPKSLVAAADRDLFRVGAEFYWHVGRQIIEGQPGQIDELRFRRESGPTQAELHKYRQLAEQAIAAQEIAQQKRMASHHAEYRSSEPT